MCPPTERSDRLFRWNFHSFTAIMLIKYAAPWLHIYNHPFINLINCVFAITPKNEIMQMPHVYAI